MSFTVREIDWAVVFNDPDNMFMSKDKPAYIVSAMTQEDAIIKAVEEYEYDGYDFDGFVRVAPVSKPIKVTRAWKMENA